MLSSKTQYACLALMQLTREYDSGQPVRACRIAEQHGIPQTFLVQIMHELKRAGLVSSTRGANGGYQLRTAPQELSLAELVELFEPLDTPEACAAAESPLAPVVLELCCELQQTLRERLASTTLADLVERACLPSAPMWYI
ncbi:RrF2 family transcriptional regulator [Adhaeretor mobilis]|uniref:HTH-type transcriptional regulator CymR n=1 Tax=Adhaeretor mobilis TaxID=1930276 RepID=A0A517MQW2_9BACT|nr:Rrf2 family transcriptional regulator [Adhaeretor mobilis]QDS97274.1 HTH-type transcriptional regulator CymR [Adhaeretor mobilis]